ncbi:MAG: hypothetical protein AAGA18_12435 [Verrucomicrobiota bacterium]
MTSIHGTCKINPSLGVVYPLEASDKGVVFNKSVILNHEAIAEKGSVAQIIFQMPQDDDRDVKEARRKSTSSIEASFSRSTNAKLLERQKPLKQLSPEQKAVLSRAYSSRWVDPIKFRGFLHKIPLNKLRLVYKPVGSEAAIIERLTLPYGMFIALDDHGVKVLAIEQSSKAHKAGLPVDSILKRINGIDIEPNLRSFLELFYEQEDKTKTENKPLPLAYQTGPDQPIEEVLFPVPYSFNSNDFFSDL